MILVGHIKKLGWQVLHWCLSVPVFVKILGIGAVVASVFGAVTIIQIRSVVWGELHQTLEQRVRTLAASLVAGLERPVSTGDLFTARQKMLRAAASFSDVRYILLRNKEGFVIAHTFAGPLPADLARPQVLTDPTKPNFRVLRAPGELIFDVTHPILEGRAGFLQIGVTDRAITEDLANITWVVLCTAVLCAVIGIGLALLLTHILTRPIRHLVDVTNRVRAGQFDVRAKVYYSDEIGELSLAFNQMVESLETYRRQVQRKEEARQALVERIVQAQEEERKFISRELHDQLGQSLSALLLAVRALGEDCPSVQQQITQLQHRIQEMIDEVRRLAWDMRPSILDDYGLEVALAKFVEETSKRSGIDIEYQYTRVPGASRLSDRIEITLYRIAQEALTNVVRHAQATRVSTVVIQQLGEVVLIVEDNGRGFCAESLAQNGRDCLGLTGMRERAALVGGTCTIESSEGQGTTVRVRIPISGS